VVGSLGIDMRWANDGTQSGFHMEWRVADEKKVASHFPLTQAPATLRLVAHACGKMPWRHLLTLAPLTTVIHFCGALRAASLSLKGKGLAGTSRLSRWAPRS